MSIHNYVIYANVSGQDNIREKMRMDIDMNVWYKYSKARTASEVTRLDRRMISWLGAQKRYCSSSLPAKGSRTAKKSRKRRESGFGDSGKPRLRESDDGGDDRGAVGRCDDGNG